MKDRIVIFGAGVVGRATEKALASYGSHDPLMIDPPCGVNPEVNLRDHDPSIAFVCVPAPFCDDGVNGAGLSAVRSALDKLDRLGKNVIVALKSTVPPGTSERLACEFKSIRLLFVPEFLTESTAQRDAEDPARNVVGFTRGDEGAAIRLARLLPRTDRTVQVVTTATEAELLKLWSNGFYAMKVTFANLMHDLARKVSPEHDADAFRSYVAADPMIANHHLDVFHKGYRGFGGKCLPKDLRMLIHTMRQHAVEHRALDAVLHYNEMLIRLQGGEPPLREQTLPATNRSTGETGSDRETS